MEFDGFENGEGVKLLMVELERGFARKRTSMEYFRRICALLVAGDREVQAFCDSDGERFFEFHDEAALRSVYEQIFDYILARLLPSENEDEVRAVERRGLQAWREVCWWLPDLAARPSRSADQIIQIISRKYWNSDRLLIGLQ